MTIKRWVVGLQTGAYEEPNWFAIETVRTEAAAIALCEQIKTELADRGLNKPQDPLADDDEDIDTYYRDVDCYSGAYPSYRVREEETLATEEELAALYSAIETLEPGSRLAKDLASLAKKLDWNK